MDKMYKIIQNPHELESFIEFLPECGRNEQFYCTLLARSKYLEDKTLIKSDKQALKRFTSSKSMLFTKIKQLETRFGNYFLDGNIIPQEALALYIMPNPRDLHLAGKNLLVTLANLITKEYSGWNPQKEAMNEIQKTSSNRRFIDFDYDTKLDESQFVKNYLVEESEIKFKINHNALHIIKTRGGFHVLVEINKVAPEFKKSWYQSLSTFSDVQGDCLLPVPGCVQGPLDFMPYIIDIEKEISKIIK